MTAVTARVLVRVQETPVDPAEAVSFVEDDVAGAVCLFLGTVRDHSEHGVVTGLRYEVWPEVAEVRLREIAGELAARWPVGRIAMIHRFGELDVGEVSVAVACSAPHRADAFEACRQGIERLKQDVPIWKQELLASGEAHWVMGS
jgi:molybdopterin synthase catalytic subunit